MKNRFHQMMPQAAFILFWVSAIMLLSGVAITIYTYFSIGASFNSSNDMMQRTLSLSAIFNELFRAIDAAAYPFFGAALLYRMDKWLEAAE